MAGTRLENRQL